MSILNVRQASAEEIEAAKRRSSGGASAGLLRKECVALFADMIASGREFLLQDTTCEKLRNRITYMQNVLRQDFPDHRLRRGVIATRSTSAVIWIEERPGDSETD